MMARLDNDTIAAISTPLGQGGIVVVRISGTDATGIADRIFDSAGGSKPSSFASYTLRRGYIKAPKTEEIIDEVLLTVMRAPKTYTAEDVVEINCHGGTMPSKRVLEVCLDEGARLAEPGEFTKRAFLNGRIDLSQAEAVLDIIRSETEASRKIALSQMRGEFSARIRVLRDSMIGILSSIELAIDFSDEDVEFAKTKEIIKRVEDVHSSISEILETSEKGIVLREGASVVICGRPNVGKSSLMNALLRDERVIVTPVAGTTRDIIEEAINISGVKVRISDTAGIIETKDRVEIEGIKRSKQKLECADIVIFMLDNSLPLSGKDKDIYDAIKDKSVIIAANKSDLKRQLDIDEVKASFSAGEVLEVSALKKKGLGKLENAIAEKLFKGKVIIPEGPIVTNMRHKKLLERARTATGRAMELAGSEYNGELVASDLNEAVHQMGLIIGESIEDDILQRIFRGFCIGK